MRTSGLSVFVAGAAVDVGGLIRFLGERRRLAETLKYLAVFVGSMVEKSFLDKPIPRGRTKKERLDIVKKIAAEVQADPELKAAVREFIRITTNR